jgi:hypothetical protein
LKPLAGIIAFKSEDVKATVENVLSRYRDFQHTEAIPACFGAQMAVATLPQIGKSMLVTFMWASNDHDAGYKYLQKITALSDVLFNTVAETTIPAWMEAASGFSIYGVHNGLMCTVVPELSEDFVKIAGKYAEQMPISHGTILAIHQLHGMPATAHPQASFPLRSPHFTVEMIGSTVEASEQDNSKAWARSFYEELKKSGVGLRGEYEPLSDPKASPSEWYSENWDRLKAIKRKYDPQRVFGSAPPQV